MSGREAQSGGDRDRKRDRKQARRLERAAPSPAPPGSSQQRPAQEIEAAHAPIEAPGAAERRAADESLLTLLTPRQREVVILTALGLSTKEIAADLGCKPKTVARHRADIAGKGLRGATEMTHFAIRMGLVEP